MTAKKIVLYMVLAILILLLLVTLVSQISAYSAKLLIYENMTYRVIKTILGSSGRVVGSGLVIYEWDFPDGSLMTVWFSNPTPGKIIPANKYQAFRIEVNESTLFPNRNPA